MPKQTDYDPEKDPKYREAREGILEAARSGATGHTLGGYQLTALPPEIGQLTARSRGFTSMTTRRSGCRRMCSG